MAHHEARLAKGEDASGDQFPVVFVDDEGAVSYPGDPGYVEPEEGSKQFLEEHAKSLVQQYEDITNREEQESLGQAPAPDEGEQQIRENVRQSVEEISDSEPPRSQPAVNQGSEAQQQVQVQEPPVAEEQQGQASHSNLSLAEAQRMAREGEPNEVQPSDARQQQ